MILLTDDKAFYCAPRRMINFKKYEVIV